MATLEVHSDVIVVRLSTLEQLGSLSGSVVVPRSSVTDVYVATPALSARSGMRAPGTGIPGVMSLGTYRSGGKRSFVAAYHRHPGSVVIDLEGQRFDRLVVSAPDPESVAASIRP